MIHYDLTQLPKSSIVYKCRCFDGDTLRVTGNNFIGIVRIWGIDAPEIGQRWFENSRKTLELITSNIQLTIIPVTWDRYNRLVAKILGHAFSDVGLRMIESGNAWHENLHAPTAIDYHHAHVSARENKLGLWSEPSPHIPPWQFRRRPHKP
jgi:endonuclease YncB( thermonuclease family)